jgi:pimeloyl-ACP methyl ester carboxylesterase
MSHYILVHGAWEESRIWDDVSPVLQQNGHVVTAVDMPGHGSNLLPLSDVTMDKYVQAVADAISQLDHPVVLVGHSMAGAVISQVAELIPEKVERLIYVAAFLLKNGGSVLEAMQSDSAGELLPEIVFSDDQSYASIPAGALRRVGFHDVDRKAIQRVLPLMAERQATEPFMAKVAVSDENFGSVPKTYIRTTIDKVTTSALQNRMISNWKVETIHNLESGHFPAFSVPEKLAELMLPSECCAQEEAEACSVGTLE